MILGYSTNAFKKFSLFEAIKKIAGLDFRGIEIMGDRPHLYPPDYTEKETGKLKKSIEENDLKITNINSFTLFAVGDTYLPSWIEPEPARREIRIRHTLDSIRIAAELGCTNISVPPGGPLADMPRSEALSLFHRGLEKVIPLAESLDIKILIEPEPDLLIERTAEFKSFIKDVRTPFLGLNFDIGHFFCVGEDPSVAFEELFEWVGHVHIEDIAPDRVHRHLIAGKGAIRFPDVFNTMKRLGYANDISLELYPYVDMPEEAGKESMNFLLPIFHDSGLMVFDRA
ncbi:MAG: sugar phosphate isomerase/epimerase family protein [Desulfobacterales bacterium]